MVTSLCSVQNVKDYLCLTNEYTDSEIQFEIDSVDSEIYGDYIPVKKTYFRLDKYFSDYLFVKRKRKLYAIDSVKVDKKVCTSQEVDWVVFNSPTDYTVDLSVGSMVMSSSVLTTYDNQGVYVEWIPKEYHLLSLCNISLNLIDKTTIVDGEITTNPQVSRLMARKERLKRGIKKMAGLNSSKYKDYDLDNSVWIKQYRVLR